tara:strand:+ start:77 stop:346 length:270 start_codon:yes stop_codon:yes gene_type:complete
MPCIVIAYTTTEINQNLVRIYNDSTEKYFEDSEDETTKNYINYLATKGYIVDSSEIKLYTNNELDIESLYRADALAKLTLEEKEALGII